jgi:hypothetical protein
MIAPRRAGIRHHHLRAVSLSDRRRPEPNRARADHQHLISRLDRCATHRVGANGEWLNQRHGFRVDVIHHQQIVYRHAEVFAKPAVAMHADHRNLLTAVCPAAQTGRALAAGDIGNHSNLLAALQIKNIFTQPNYLTAYFMSKNTRITKKG